MHHVSIYLSIYLSIYPLLSLFNVLISHFLCRFCFPVNSLCLISLSLSLSSRTYLNACKAINPAVAILQAFTTEEGSYRAPFFTSSWSLPFLNYPCFFLFFFFFLRHSLTLQPLLPFIPICCYDKTLNNNIGTPIAKIRRQQRPERPHLSVHPARIYLSLIPRRRTSFWEQAPFF